MSPSNTCVHTCALRLAVAAWSICVTLGMGMLKWSDLPWIDWATVPDRCTVASKVSAWASCHHHQCSSTVTCTIRMEHAHAQLTIQHCQQVCTHFVKCSFLTADGKCKPQVLSNASMLSAFQCKHALCKHVQCKQIQCKHVANMHTARQKSMHILPRSAQGDPAIWVFWTATMTQAWE